jgi:uncharacterized protein (DUF2267 family)
MEAQMSATGLDVFDKSLQTTNIWLNDITEQIGPDRQLAWHVLGVVLRTLRDRLPADHAAHLASQLPLVVRGAYYEQYRPSIQPDDTLSKAADFVARVAEGLAAVRPVDPEDAITAVFNVLETHVPAGQAQKTRQALPDDLRRYWPHEGDPEARIPPKARTDGPTHSERRTH